MIEPLAHRDWERVASDMLEKGYAHIDNVLSDDQCSQLIAGFDDHQLYRKTVDMERYRFGAGTYKYFKYPLPKLISQLRREVYPKLAPIANQWMNDLKINLAYPERLVGLKQLCAKHNQNLATPLILKYEKGGYNTLHQDLYGEVYFPMQAVLFLNEYGKDYTGGEFVLTQQIPRAQSKAIVLHPKKGSLLIFPTNYRPMQGKKGHYRVTMRHGVSELHSGTRYTMGIIFHDAAK